MIPYASLTSAQREQVAHLFYDDLFGTDPAHFEYLVNDGQICNRFRIAECGDARSNIHAHKPRKVETVITVREVEGGNSVEFFKSVARSVIERVTQPIPSQEA